MSNSNWVNGAMTAVLMACVGSALGGCWARVRDGHDGDPREVREGDHDRDHDHHEEHREDRH